MENDERLPKSEILRGARHFSKLYNSGNSTAGDFLKLYTAPNGLPVSRIGFSLAGRKLPLSNERNRMKRLLREAYRRNKRYIKTGFDFALVLKRPAKRGDLEYPAVEKELLNIFKRANLSV